jgi:16S rRNA (adenine1518-N6/adenine1519-N6)-dimethyltransferase
LIFHALRPPRPELAVFLVQKEVAERAVAPPGSRTYGALSVNLQAFASVELLFTVPPGAFVPRPKVDSAVLRFRPHREPMIAPADEDRFRALVQAAFSQRRKQLQRILRATHALSADAAQSVIRKCGLDPSMRPEMLAPSEFVMLLRALSSRDG